MAVVPTSEYIVLKDFVNSVDKKAFIFVANTYDINHQDETITKIKESHRKLFPVIFLFMHTSA